MIVQFGACSRTTVAMVGEMFPQAEGKFMPSAKPSLPEGATNSQPNGITFNPRTTISLSPVEPRTTLYTHTVPTTQFNTRPHTTEE